MTGDSKYESIESGRKEIKTMCDVAERLVKKGETKGKFDFCAQLVKDEVISPKEGAKRLGLSLSEFNKAYKEWLKNSQTTK